MIWAQILGLNLHYLRFMHIFFRLRSVFACSGFWIAYLRVSSQVFGEKYEA